jgi:outer membrane protein assembly factor BamB
VSVQSHLGLNPCCTAVSSLKYLRILGFLILVLPACSVNAIDWYRWRGPDLNGISKETGWTVAWPKEGPAMLWKASVSTGFSSVAVSQGRVFTMGNESDVDTVYCLDEKTGAVRWKHSYRCELQPKYYEGGPGATPTVDGDRVFTISKNGDVFCFETASGKIVWQKHLQKDLGAKRPEWGFAGSALVLGNKLFLNAGEAGAALDKRSGEVLWKSAGTAAGYATPVPLTIEGKSCLAIFAAKALALVEAETGRELWRHPWVTGWDINAADPIVHGDKIFISSFSRGCALLEASLTKATVLWENKNMGNHFNSCVLVNGSIYGVDGNTDKPGVELRCLDFATGAVQWAQKGVGLGSLMAADQKLIVLSDRGELVVAEASPQSFKTLARAQVLGGKCWTQPVLSNGRIYCRNAQGTLVCLDVSGK